MSYFKFSLINLFTVYDNKRVANTNIPDQLSQTPPYMNRPTSPIKYSSTDIDFGFWIEVLIGSCWNPNPDSLIMYLRKKSIRCWMAWWFWYSRFWLSFIISLSSRNFNYCTWSLSIEYVIIPISDKSTHQQIRINQIPIFPSALVITSLSSPLLKDEGQPLLVLTWCLSALSSPSTLIFHRGCEA